MSYLPQPQPFGTYCLRFRVWDEYLFDMKTTERAFKKLILDETKKNKTYRKGATELLVDALVRSIRTIQECEQDIDTRGYQINVSRSEIPYYNPNPMVNVEHQATKTLQSLIRQLSLSPDTILKLKLEEGKSGLSELQKLWDN